MPSTGQDIITALSLWRSFPVISGSSTFSYKGQSSDIRKVARDLGARYIIEGSIRLSDQRVRVAAQLIDADSGHHVWGPRKFRGRSDVVASDAEAGLEGGPRPSRQLGRAPGSDSVIRVSGSRLSWTRKSRSGCTALSGAMWRV